MDRMLNQEIMKQFARSKIASGEVCTEDHFHPKVYYFVELQPLNMP